MIISADRYCRHVTVVELDEAIRACRSSSAGLPAVERKAVDDVIGHCRLINRGRVTELWRSSCARPGGRDYATEAAMASASGAIFQWRQPVVTCTPREDAQA